MNLKLDNQLALVTGSTGGIGLEIARSLAREGARVIINGRSVSSVDGAISAIRKEHPEAKLEKLATDNGAAAGTEETIAAVPARGHPRQQPWHL
jgi:3-oxoacyl-[acyl-carrier protein] reductase